MLVHWTNSGLSTLYTNVIFHLAIVKPTQQTASPHPERNHYRLFKCSLYLNSNRRQTCGGTFKKKSEFQGILLCKQFLLKRFVKVGCIGLKLVAVCVLQGRETITCGNTHRTSWTRYCEQVCVSLSFVSFFSFFFFPFFILLLSLKFNPEVKGYILGTFESLIYHQKHRKKLIYIDPPALNQKRKTQKENNFDLVRFIEIWYALF